MTPKQIRATFAGKLIGSRFMQNCVCRVVSLLPSDQIAYITSNCWFISSLPDAWGFVFTGNDLQDQHLIFLNPDLFFQGMPQINYSIAHEIAHVILGHRNSTFYRQSKSEIESQETAVDEFARRIRLIAAE